MSNEILNAKEVYASLTVILGQQAPAVIEKLKKSLAKNAKSVASTAQVIASMFQKNSYETSAGICLGNIVEEHPHKYGNMPDSPGNREVFEYALFKDNSALFFGDEVWSVASQDMVKYLITLPATGQESS